VVDARKAVEALTHFPASNVFPRRIPSVCRAQNGER
jgi:hypothetical protein